MFKRYILLGWFSASDETDKNFGDELSYYIVNKLSGKKIYRVTLIKRRMIPFLILKRIILLDFKYLQKSLKGLILFFISRQYLLVIGSILQDYKSKGAIVWGTGIMDYIRPVAKFKFLSVRGKETRNKLLSLGYQVPEIYGDPGMLLPIIYRPVNIKVSHEIGIIPHVIHYEKMKAIMSSDFYIIDFRSSQIEKIIDQILSCKYVISSSLHGLIVSHSYNVKALWYAFKDIPLHGDNIKFKDYFSSVGIEYYQPFLFDNISAENIFGTFKENIRAASPAINIYTLQKNLLGIAPFKILPEYQLK